MYLLCKNVIVYYDVLVFKAFGGMLVQQHFVVMIVRSLVIGPVYSINTRCLYSIVRYVN